MDDKDPPKPAPESAAYLGPTTDHRGVLKKHKLPLGNAESLAALAGEFVFFSPGALYVYGRFTDAYLIDMMVLLGRDVPVWFHKFQRPVFCGLETRAGDRDWNHVLFATRPDDWPLFADFVCGITGADSATKTTYQYGLQDLLVADPVRADRVTLAADQPLVAVHGWGVYGNRFRVSFEPGVLGMPTLRRFPPAEEDRVYGAALFAGQNPFHARDLYRQRQGKAP